MWLRLGTSFYRLKNKQENEQNGGPEKPYENLMDGYYLAAPGWMAVVRFKRWGGGFVLGEDHIVAREMNATERFPLYCRDLFKSQTL